MIKLLHFEDVDQVIQKYFLDLSVLYEDAVSRANFEKKWQSFYQSDDANKDIFFREEHIFSYLSECLIPSKVDTRVPLLIILGNPAPHSIKLKMFFSYEGNGREHRFWSVLQQTGILKFDYDLSYSDINEFRKQHMLNISYESLYRIGLCPFFSLATSPSNEPFTGVSGLERLFGKRAFRKIAEQEQERVKELIKKFMPNGGLVLVFQKDAFNYLKSPNTPEYSLKNIDYNNEYVPTFFDDSIKLILCPPTRLLHSQRTKKILSKIATGDYIL